MARNRPSSADTAIHSVSERPLASGVEQQERGCRPDRRRQARSCLAVPRQQQRFRGHQRPLHCEEQHPPACRGRDCRHFLGAGESIPTPPEVGEAGCSLRPLKGRAHGLAAQQKSAVALWRAVGRAQGQLWQADAAARSSSGSRQGTCRRLRCITPCSQGGGLLQASVWAAAASAAASASRQRCQRTEAEGGSVGCC